VDSFNARALAAMKNSLTWWLRLAQQFPFADLDAHKFRKISIEGWLGNIEISKAPTAV
jgi:hypothetical protein